MSKKRHNKLNEDISIIFSLLKNVPAIFWHSLDCFKTEKFYYTHVYSIELAKILCRLFKIVKRSDILFWKFTTFFHYIRSWKLRFFAKMAHKFHMMNAIKKLALFHHDFLTAFIMEKWHFLVIGNHDEKLRKDLNLSLLYSKNVKRLV